MAPPVKSRKGLTYPGKVRMVEVLEDLIEDDADEIDERVSEVGCDDISDLPLFEIRRLYDRLIRNPASTVRKSKINPKEFAVEQFSATVIVDKSRRLVNIHIEDADGKFLTFNDERHERALGAEMPLYMAIPQELYEAIKAA
jgi:hypothetical protein